MASGYQSNTVDFDDLFEARITPKIANLGYHVNGSDITNRYETAASGTAAGNVGYQVNGTDIGTRFAAAGGVPVWDGGFGSLPSSLNDTQWIAQALIEVTFMSDGRIRVRRSNVEQFMGRWDGSVANSANTRIRFVVTSGSLSNNGASSWSQLNQDRSMGVFTIAGPEYRSASVEIQLEQLNAPSTRRNRTINLSAITNSDNDGPPELEP